MVNDVGYIADDIGSNGTVTVSGIGPSGGPSTWTNTSDLVVGQFGTGSLSILSGGSVSNLVGYVGASPGGLGTVIISGRAANGAISTWTNTRYLLVGDEGTGILTVENGGALNTGAAYIGYRPDGQGTVIIGGQDASGNPSTWVNTGNFFVGQDGTGILTVDSGGLVQTDSDMTIAASSTATGTLNLVGTAAGRGILETGSVINGAGSATLNLDGGILRATRDQSNFLSGFTNLALSSGGAWFDTNAHDIGMDTAFSGSSDLVKLGLGKLTLTGNSSTFTGTTSVEAGTLAVNGVVGGTMVVSNGRLQGVGTIGTTTVASGGTIAPGNSIGILTVAGNLLLHPGSLYEVEIASNGASDRIDVVGGTATVTGANVEVLRLDPDTSYQNGQTYRILDADGGVVGEFADIATRSAFLDFGLDHGTNGVDLRISLKTNEPEPRPEPEPKPLFSRVAETGNQLATAGALDGLQQSGPQLALYNALLMLDAGQARAAFDQLSGEIHASAKTALIEDSRFVREAAAARVRAAFEGVGATSSPVLAYGPDGQELAAAATESAAAWGSVFGSWGSNDGNGNAAGFDRATGGFFTGLDGLVTENVRLGILTGYGHSSFDADDRASSGSSDTYHLGLYGGTQMGALGLRAGAAYSWHDIDTARSVAFPGFADSLTASYDAGTFQAFGEAGYRIDTASVAFEPFANLAYVNLHSDGFAEKGGAAALTSASQTLDATFTTLGVRASTGFAVGTINATARGMLGWKHAFGDVVPLATHAFAGSNAFTVAGAPIARNAAIIEAGLDFDIAPMAKIGVSYTGEIASKARDHGFKADLSVRF